MGNVDLSNGLLGMLDALLIPVAVILLWLILSALRRVERALWAAVSQLQSLRAEVKSRREAVGPKPANEASRTDGEVFMSMFGR